ncbi:hypothetical protein [Pontibacter sp. HJ8]
MDKKASVLSQLKASTFQRMVYRKANFNVLYPDGVWELHAATEVEPNDIFKCPLTRPQACVYADITPAKLKKLVTNGYLPEHKLSGYNGKAYVHEEIAHALEVYDMYN